MSGALKRDEWETVRLGDVCEIGDGLHGTPKYDEHGEYYFINGTNLSNGRIIFDEKTKRVDENTYKKYRIEFGNTLLMSINGTIGNIAYYADEKIVLGKSAAYITTKTPNLNLTYLSHYLQSATAKQYYENNLTGSTIKNLGLKVLRSFELPIPPLDIQRRIAETLDKVTELIILRKTQLEKLDELVKARFVEMFGTENEFGKWPCCTIGDVADVCVGVVIKPTQYYTDNGIPAFRSLNIGEMRVKDSDWVYFTEEGHEKNQKSVIRKNDVLVVRSGAPGTACVATEKYDGYNAVDIIIAHPDNSKVNSIFLAAFTNMPHGMNQIRAKTGGAAQQHFNVGGYKAMNLIMPPIELQNQFAAFVEQTDKSKVIIQQSLDTLETLKKSLMQEYFG